MALRTYGTMAVDWEKRVDFDRLRRERLARIKELLAKSRLGALLCFDMNNVRYITATHIGTWAQDKISRFTLLPQNDEPILWDFGSAARHHQLNCPWLGERSRPGIPSMRGAMTPEMGREEDVAKKIRDRAGGARAAQRTAWRRCCRAAVMFALQREGINVVDGQELMSIAREIKTEDEITLLNMSAMMVDAAYYDLYKAMKPGHARERSRRARAATAVRARVGVRGSGQRDFRGALQSASACLLGPRAPAWRSRLLRHPPLVHGLSHLLLPDIRGRLGVARDGRCLQAVPRLSRRVD